MVETIGLDSGKHDAIEKLERGEISKLPASHFASDKPRSLAYLQAVADERVIPCTSEVDGQPVNLNMYMIQPLDTSSGVVIEQPDSVTLLTVPLEDS